ncbi:hypothetical protein VE03_03610 [Pseudogymnoascus sp. 23342-1-I1]|nr:hypothetical protein VE03_03643 [Pseudogymnoascus sp. 23342-1-I1]OBT66567.1 hypothetical protein VE03_03610 [Pseudogymnoascus sp. 23342-1-I1]
MSGRDCSFTSQPQASPEKLSTSSVSPHEPVIRIGNNHSEGGITVPNIAPFTAVTPSNSGHPGRLSINDHYDPTLNEIVNPTHMELLMHLLLEKEMFSLGIKVGDYLSNISIALKLALKSPYLLHQLLAFSARHLAFLHPERSASYLHQAVTLQTHAVSLFNAAWTEVSQSNCVEALLFSSVLGHHILTDTLAKRDDGGLVVFIAHYIQCVEVHRGIYTIARTVWPLLMDSELGPILSLTAEFTSRQPKGSHCQQIRELVNCSDGLGEEAKKACQVAIDYLQVGFDAVMADEETQGVRHQMIFSWTLLVPPELTDLFTAKRPEILVLLAYYAVLLHYGKNMWQVGDSGAYILGIIVDYVGPEWDHWLKYPQEMVANGFEHSI